jgi:hypothetical protein
MTLPMVLAPLFVQVALTFFLLFGMASQRYVAFRDRKVRWQDARRSSKTDWPDRAAQFGDSFRNQFEVPVLFYVLTILEVITRQADLLFVLLSWVFVALRFAQAYIHTTSNFVPRRGQAYAAACLVLLAMWVIFALRIYVIQ